MQISAELAGLEGKCRRAVRDEEDGRGHSYRRMIAHGHSIQRCTDIDRHFFTGALELQHLAESLIFRIQKIRKPFGSKIKIKLECSVMYLRKPFGQDQKLPKDTKSVWRESKTKQMTKDQRHNIIMTMAAGGGMDY